MQGQGTEVEACAGAQTISGGGATLFLHLLQTGADDLKIVQGEKSEGKKSDEGGENGKTV